MKKRLVILITTAIVVVAAVAGVMIFALSGFDNTDAPTWREQYDLGVRYLSSGNYEEAVIAFKAAIEIDPRKADAYLGLADAYIGLGDMEKAEDILTDALDAVRSSDRADIESKLAELDPTAPIEPPPDDLDSTEPPEPVHTHTWLDATCTEPRTCSECGETEGEPLGHDMLPATTEAPATCVRCGYTEGEPLESYIIWNLENGTLTISGAGPIDYFYTDEAPWYGRRDEIERVIIENGMTTIGDSAFCSCSNLTSIVIPSSVTEVDFGAFSWCRKLESITVEEGNSNYVSVDGVLFSKDMTLLQKYPAGKSAAEYTIPSSVTIIGDEAFEYYRSLTSIVIPDSVTTIGRAAFENCSNLTSVVIPDSVTTIGRAAFRYCDNLASVVIPDSVTKIGNGAFWDCHSLTSVVIPSGVTEIGEEAFIGDINLESITVEEGNRNYVSVDGVLFSKDMTLLHTCPEGKGVTEYIIPFGVTTIGVTAFFSCDSLTSVVIPDSVTTIDREAFGYCEKLTSITIPDGVTTIAQSTFYYCYSLTSITIPDSVTTIGPLAFSYCVNLKSITIPSSVTSIGERVFESCRHLTDIYYGGTAEQWAAISAEADVPEAAVVHYSSER